jgi:hypothetical protein
MNNFVKTWRDYKGEDLVLGVDYVNGERVMDIEKYESLPYEVRTKGYAIVLGNGASRSKLTVEEYYLNNGGLRNKFKAETYGCNALYKDGDVDHLIVTNKSLLDKAIKSRIYNRMALYTTYPNWLRTEAKKLRLVPQKYLADAGTLALYMACFHGNHTVYMIGFDHTEGVKTNVYEGTEFYQSHHSPEECQKWVSAQLKLMKQYPDVNFTRVVSKPYAMRKHPWLELSNYREIDFRSFIDLADIGKITRD